MSGTIRTPIIDRNGKPTTVYKNPDAVGGSNRAKGIGNPPSGGKGTVPGLQTGKPTGVVWSPNSYIEGADPNTTVIVEPANRAETLKELNDISGRKSKGNVRWIELNYVNTDTSRVRDEPGLSRYELPIGERKDTFNIVPPKDGTPVIIRNASGFNQLNIESGNAVIVLESRSGNPLTISGDANVVVMLGEDAKCSLDVSGEATVQIIPNIGSRGSVSPSENATVDIMDYIAGDDQHSFRDLSVPVDYEAIARTRAEKVAHDEDALEKWMNNNKKEN